MSKLEEKELKELRESQGKINVIKMDIGTLMGQIHSLNHMQIDEINKQSELKKSLEEKYGKITVDLESGEFTKIDDDSKLKE
tara:strand:- start:11742 stop:11987 length:246 start_codon:yes stop_codon:yes gene_type:complete